MDGKYRQLVPSHEKQKYEDAGETQSETDGNINNWPPPRGGASKSKANVRAAENLYRKATGDGREAVTAAIFWLKTRAGWNKTSVHELRDEWPLSAWSDEELNQRIDVLQKLIASAPSSEILGGGIARSAWSSRKPVVVSDTR